MNRISQQIAQPVVPQDGPVFVDPVDLPGAPPDAVCLVHVLNGKAVAGVWVDKDHGGTMAEPFPEVTEASWLFWNGAHERVTFRPAPVVAQERPRPRLLELLSLVASAPILW